MKTWLQLLGEFLESKGGQLAILMACIVLSMFTTCFVMIKFGAGAPVAITISGVLTTFVGALVGLVSGKSASTSETK